MALVLAVGFAPVLVAGIIFIGFGGFGLSAQAQPLYSKEWCQNYIDQYPFAGIPKECEEKINPMVNAQGENGGGGGGGGSGAANAATGYVKLINGNSIPCVLPTMKLGDSNSSVMLLQTVLKKAGYFSPSYFTTYYGILTVDAVGKFQNNNGLSRTGLVDEDTAKFLNALVKSYYPAECGVVSSPAVTSSSATPPPAGAPSVADLQAQIAALLAQINALKAQLEQSAGLVPVVNENKTVGGDKDVHGCFISAGYSWCGVKNKCLRIWEEKCEATPVFTSPSDLFNTPQAVLYCGNEYKFSIPGFAGNQVILKQTKNGQLSYHGSINIPMTYKFVCDKDEGSYTNDVYDGQEKAGDGNLIGSVSIAVAKKSSDLISHPPVFTDASGVQQTTLYCGKPYRFSVIGYSQVWLEQMKNGATVYNSSYNIPSTYTPICGQDEGNYVHNVYETNGSVRGRYLGTVSAKIMSSVSPVTPVFTLLTANSSNTPQSTLYCGQKYQFSVSGYSQVWLEQTKNDKSSYSGLTNVPLTYTFICNQDEGSYVNKVYTVKGNNKGDFIGSSAETVVKPDGGLGLNPPSSSQMANVLESMKALLNRLKDSL